MRDQEDDYEEDAENLDEDIYTEEGRELAEEDDEISAEEAGFMEGYEEGEKLAKCKTCHKAISDDPDEVIEEEYNNKIYRFCSQRCADVFNRKHNKED